MAWTKREPVDTVVDAGFRPFLLVGLAFEDVGRFVDLEPLRLREEPRRRFRWEKRNRSRSVQKLERRASRVRNGWPHSRQNAAPR
jgi:hypothetical protein